MVGQMVEMKAVEKDVESAERLAVSKVSRTAEWKAEKWVD